MIKDDQTAKNLQDIKDDANLIPKQQGERHIDRLNAFSHAPFFDHNDRQNLRIASSLYCLESSAGAERCQWGGLALLWGATRYCLIQRS